MSKESRRYKVGLKEVKNWRQSIGDSFEIFSGKRQRNGLTARRMRESREGSSKDGRHNSQFIVNVTTTDGNYSVEKEKAEL